MASFVFNKAVEEMVRGSLNFEGTTFKMLLVTSAYTETEKDNFEDRADVTGEVSNASQGYTTGGAVTNATVSADDTTNQITVAFSDVSFTNATITAAGAVIYKSTGTEANDTVVAFLDFGGNVASTNGTFTVSVTTPLTIQN